MPIKRLMIITSIVLMLLAMIFANTTESPSEGISGASGGTSSGFEKKDSDLTEIEVDEMLGLVGHIGAEVTANNAMPGGVVLFVEFLLDEGSDVLLNVEFLEGLGGDINSILLHVFGHVSILNNSFAVGHLIKSKKYYYKTGILSRL